MSEIPYQARDNTRRAFVFMNFEAGSNIEFKHLDEKTIIAAKNTTRIKETNFELEAEQIIFEAGRGVKISSRGKDTLVISVELTKIEERIFDFEKRIAVVEKSLVSIMTMLKALKVIEK